MFLTALGNNSLGKRMLPFKKLLRIMKLTAIFIFLACVAASAGGYAQKVSISERNASLEKLFKIIEGQTGYVFFYDVSVLKKSKSVSLRVNNLSLEETLALCFKEQPLTYSILNKTIVVKPKQELVTTSPTAADMPSVPPPVEVTGTVKSENTGEPLVGATVKVKSASKGTVTNSKGQFTLSVEEGATLVISNIGYVDKEIKVTKAGNYEIKLEVSSKSMNDVVVTGLFVRPKANYTGASSSFSGEDLAKVSNDNLLTALKSVDPSFQLPENINLGSNPNALPEVVLRSGNSLVDLSQPNNTPFSYTNGVNTPLFILDGFEVSLQRINDLDMNRITKVDILKDAAATAIYGSRAANGVIVIETIRPKDGKLRFTYNGNLSVETPDLSSYDLLNASEKFAIENKANAYTFYNWNFREQDLAFFYNARLAAIKSGVNTDWLSKPVQTGIGQKHNIYVEGGGNDALYGINLTYNRISGAMKGSDRTNISGNSFLSYRVKNFQFRNDLTIYTNKANNSPYGSFTQYSRLNPYWTPYDSTGNMKIYLEDVRNLAGTRLTNFDTYDNLDGQPAGRATNPLYNAGLNIVDQTSYNNITNNFSLQWQVKQWLRVSGRVAFQYQADEADKFLPAQHTSFVSKPTFEKGTYTKGYGKKKNLEGMLTADVNKAIGDHMIFGTVGINANEAKYHTESFMVQGFPNPNLDQLVLGNRFPDATKPTGYESISRMIGFLSNLSYSYNNRFLVDLSYRIDGSSQFGTDKRFAPFWSVGTGWNLHNEKFFKDLSYINRLKLRYSFGYTGSQNFASYLGLTTSQYYTDREYRGVISTYLLGFGNSALAWQKTQKNNIGTDITLFKRLDITANYFIEKTQGSIASISTAPSTGFTSYAENMGDVIGRGWELNTRYNIISNPRKRDNWSVFVNMFSVKNKIERVSNTIAKLNEAANNTKTSRPIVRYAAGQSTSAIWAVPSLGIDPSTGYEIFVKRDGTLTNVYDPRDQKIVGDTRAKVEGTFGTNFEKNGIGFNVFFRFRYGGQAYNQTLIERVENVNVALYNVDRRVAEQRWLKPGDRTFFKALIDQAGYAISEPTYATSRFVQDDNVLALESISAYYRFSDKFNKRLRVQNTRVTLYSGDVFWMSTIKRERGLDYPYARNFTLQLQTSF
jgi:TonB-linked SusC/RagA family outer membrane protein